MQCTYLLGEDVMRKTIYNMFKKILRIKMRLNNIRINNHHFK